MKRKTTAIMTALTLAIGLSACGGKTPVSTDTVSVEETETEIETEETEEDTVPEGTEEDMSDGQSVPIEIKKAEIVKDDGTGEAATEAYASFMSGDVSLFDSENIDR